MSDRLKKYLSRSRGDAQGPDREGNAIGQDMAPPPCVLEERVNRISDAAAASDPVTDGPFSTAPTGALRV